MPVRRSECGFTLVEVLIATVIAGILFATMTQMFMVWAKKAALDAQREKRRQVETDLRRLEQHIWAHMVHGHGFPNIGPWPPETPGQGVVPWKRPAPGFEELGWAPAKSPVHMQYFVDGWATGFIVGAIGDVNKDGVLEMYRIWGDVSMFEGPIDIPSVSPVSP